MDTLSYADTTYTHVVNEMRGKKLLMGEVL